MAELSPGHQHIIRSLWNGIVDLQGANSSLKGQITANKTAIATATASTPSSGASSSQTVIVAANNIGTVNNQEAATAYTTTQADYGAIILFSDASPIALTLSSGGSSPGIQLPFYCFVINEGVGLVTATPTSGTISYPNNLAAGSMPIPEFFGAFITYDGTDFWALLFPVPPQNTPAVTHEWLNSYNSTTGVFGQSQPAFTDISGTVAPSQLPDPTLTTLGGVEANTPVAHEWVNAINTSGVPQLSQPTAADVVPASSTTVGRPAGVATGFMDFDTDLGIPIWWNGAAWVNASGTPV